MLRRPPSDDTTRQGPTRSLCGSAPLCGELEACEIMLVGRPELVFEPDSRINMEHVEHEHVLVRLHRRTLKPSALNPLTCAHIEGPPGRLVPLILEASLYDVACGSARCRWGGERFRIYFELG